MTPKTHNTGINIDNGTEIEHPFLLEYTGLTMENALNNLYTEILQFQNEFCKKKRLQVLYEVLKNSFHHKSCYTTLSWIPISVLMLFLLTLSVLNLSRYSTLIIVVLIVINVGIVCWDNYLKTTELKSKISNVLKLVKKIQKRNNWHPTQFPSLYIPNSPSVSLQWTIRDGRLINLPTFLLAKDDIIIMRPGHQAPAEVVSVSTSGQDDKFGTLLTDQIFSCEPDMDDTKAVHTDSAYCSVERQPFEDRAYRVRRGPFVAQLTVTRDKYSRRPVSLYNKARYLLFGKCMHHVTLPICFMLCIILAVIRWHFLPSMCSNCTKVEEFVYIVVIETFPILISLIAFVFPLCWFLCNVFGNAIILSCYPLLEENQKRSSIIKLSDDFKDFTSPVSSKSGSFSKAEKKGNAWWRKCIRLKDHLSNLLFNNGITATHCTNFLHTLASVTVLCCVDKKGVLSWPNPTAEKVFFLKEAIGGSKIARSSSETDGAYQTTFTDNDAAATPVVEVLDITPRDNTGSAWKIEFDDARWQNYIHSLKPLGLAILLNTCNKKTHNSYNQFCCHITNHALFSQHLVPVSNRRCLCEVARQIGFNDHAVENNYNLDLQLFTYDNLAITQTDNKYVQAFFKTRKPKFPFPHAMSVIVDDSCRGRRDRFSNSFKDKRRLSLKGKEKQMFSQGTADVILDYCIDYWDGNDVRPLTPAMRKKILDFYQRSSLTAYCTAFSYRPIYKNIGMLSTLPEKGRTIYLELLKTAEHRQKHRKRRRRRKYQSPSDEFESDDRSSRMHKIIRNKHIFVRQGSNSRKECESSAILQKVFEYDEDVETLCDYDEESYIFEDNRCYDYYDEDEDEEEDDDELDFYEEEQKYDFMRRQSGGGGGGNADVNRNPKSVANYYQLLNKQIFLGMVSMQYQPLLDMVQMVEELEKACIRFVHFSKENELRSRVFSEKMGLESGWNCHISLLSESDSNQSTEGGGSNENGFVNVYMDNVMETGASSADDEEKVPFAFDMSNRAKLPCGIGNIKPHLEQVDNVPLLVSLFTDCTSDTTEQMLSIMQEYGQILCVLGSSANVKNFSIFAQADTSISVEPLYAQVCQQVPPSVLPKETVCKSSDFLSPVEFSQILNSFPCSLVLKRPYGYGSLPIQSLVFQSRNIMRLVWNYSQFWLCCIALTSCTQLLSLALLLPAIFTLEQTLVISCIVIPCLSISLMTASYDESIMTKATGKDWLCSVNWTTTSYALYCYGTKISSGIIFTLVSYLIILFSTCDCMSEAPNNGTLLSHPDGTNFERFWVYVRTTNTSENVELQMEYVDAVNIIQDFMVLVATLHMVALCTSFLYRDTLFWRRIPCLNIVWIVCISLPFICQAVRFAFMVSIWSSTTKMKCVLNTLCSIQNLVIAFFPPCITYLICESVKIYEISSSERYQKKMRLEFGTKLGMNSPF